MPYIFTADQKQILKNLLGNRNPDDVNVRFDDIYRKIVEFIDGNPDPDVQAVELFLRGAAQIEPG